MFFLTAESQRIARGESVLWQGRPLASGLARRMFPVRFLIVYFAALATWTIVNGIDGGAARHSIGVGLLWTAGGGAVIAMAILVAAAVFSACSMYTLTDRRVIMQIGVVLPITLTLPLRNIVSADALFYSNGSGDIPLSLGREKLAYLLLWPHARPWCFAAPQPMLRAVPDAGRVVAALARALHAVQVGQLPDREAA